MDSNGGSRRLATEVAGRRRELARSLRHPHPETERLIEGTGFWDLPEEDTAALVDTSAAREVRWVAGTGWEDRGRD